MFCILAVIENNNDNHMFQQMLGCVAQVWLPVHYVTLFILAAVGGT